MKRVARGFVRRIPQALPPALYPVLVPRDLIGVFYHAVSDSSLAHVKHLYPPVTTARFEAALLYLQQNYNFVTYAQVEQHRLSGAALPAQAVHLSFDDGFAENFTLVRPLLLKHGIPCTFFVTTDWLDNKSMFYRNKVSLAIERLGELPQDAAKMAFTSINNALNLSIGTRADFERWIRTLTWGDQPVVNLVVKMLGIHIGEYLEGYKPYMTSEQVRQLAADGFTIGSHTKSHPKLVQVDQAELESQIVDSSRIVQELTGAPSVPFSFPNSATGLDRKVLAAIRQRHPFLGLFFDTKGLRQDEPFIVNRIWAEKAAFAELGKETNLPHLIRAAYIDELLASRRPAEQGAGEVF
jgi:peptidoglycan/xylan/chitin deacetylase (PgdA/CDA1 family)